MDEIRSKIETAEQLMTRPEGATMDEILAATGGSYQYNAKRRLEARGYRIRTRKDGRLTRYWAEAPRTRVFEAELSARGQITVPRAVRKKLGLRSGQKLQFTLQDDGRILIAPVFARLSALTGILPKPRRALSIQDIDEAIQRAAVQRFLKARNTVERPDGGRRRRVKR
jgi:antitoxin PrlF